MEKIVNVDGKEVRFVANARTPRLYRTKMRRDIIRDLNQLKSAFDKALSLIKLPHPGPDAAPEEVEKYNQAVEEKQLSVLDLQIFEDVSFIMAWQAAKDDPTFPKTADEWLENFKTFSIYKILPDILELWGLNNETTSTPKNP